MKRKKWSEQEEQTLLSKYADLLNSGALSKLKTREKKFKPIAEHVNALHHNQDPITFPFKWTWRDVSIKVQNMRHQYLGVKQKIRVSDHEFNWDDGEIHWENFLKYKQVFGDIELPECCGKDGIGNDTSNGQPNRGKGISDILGYGMNGEDMEDEDEDEDEDEVDEEGEELGEEDEADLGINGGGGDGGEDSKGGNEKLGQFGGEKLRRGLKGKKCRVLGAKVLELKELILKREAKRMETDWTKDAKSMDSEIARKEREMHFQERINEREERMQAKEQELEEMQMAWMKREVQKRRRVERELEEERWRRMKVEEKWEEEEMEWRERMIEMQMEHEKQMMQIHADACQNQLQVLGAVARLVCQFFGSGGDVGTPLPPQDLQNLQQHPGGLGDGDQKPDDASLPSEFL